MARTGAIPPQLLGARRRCGGRLEGAANGADRQAALARRAVGRARLFAPGRPRARRRGGGRLAPVRARGEIALGPPRMVAGPAIRDADPASAARWDAAA